MNKILLNFLLKDSRIFNNFWLKFHAQPSPAQPIPAQPSFLWSFYCPDGVRMAARRTSWPRLLAYQTRTLRMSQSGKYVKIRRAIANGVTDPEFYSPAVLPVLLYWHLSLLRYLGRPRPTPLTLLQQKRYDYYYHPRLWLPNPVIPSATLSVFVGERGKCFRTGLVSRRSRGSGQKSAK